MLDSCDRGSPNGIRDYRDHHAGRPTGFAVDRGRPDGAGRHQLADRGDHHPRQGTPDRHDAAAGRGRRRRWRAIWPMPDPRGDPGQRRLFLTGTRSAVPRSARTWSATSGDEPVCRAGMPRWGHTGSVMPWPGRWWPRAWCSPTSARCCGTATWPPPRSTPRSTSTRCGWWPDRGRLAFRDGRSRTMTALRGGVERLPGAAQQARPQARRVGAAAASVRGLDGRHGPVHGHHRRRVGVVPAAAFDGTGQRDLAAPDDRGPRVRPLPVRDRPGHPDAAAGAAARTTPLDTALHLHPRRRRHVAAGSPAVALTAAGSHLRDVVRVARDHRHAGREKRSGSTRPTWTTSPG